MKKLVVMGIAILLFSISVYTPSIKADKIDSWVRIVQPESGIYINGRKVMNSHSYVFIGTDFVNVEVETSSNIFTVFMAIYDVMKKDTVDSVWDYDRSDGFSCNFTGLKTGIYAIAAAGAALDIEEPIAFDWIMPVIIIHV